MDTVAKLKVEYQGKEYEFEKNLGPDVTEEVAEFMFEDGNYSCDCNLSLFLAEKYPDFPELDCGNDQIEILSIEVIKREAG